MKKIFVTSLLVFLTTTLVNSQGFYLQKIVDGKPCVGCDFISPADKKKELIQELEFQLLINKKVARGWEKVNSLPKEPDYQITYTGDKPEVLLTYRLQRFTLNVGDELLIQIRNRKTADVSSNISVE